MNQESAIKLFKCLADKSRIQILCSLMEEDMYVERLAERLNLTPPTISFHLKKLEDAKVVTKKKGRFHDRDCQKPCSREQGSGSGYFRGDDCSGQG